MILSTNEQSQGPHADRLIPPEPSPCPCARERDAEHIRRFLAGDEQAFAELMRVHRGKVFAIAVSVLRNPADADEIVQDTFIRAHRGLAGFRGDSSLATWLYHIASNLARNRYWYFRRRRRQDSRSLEAAVGLDGEGTFAALIADPTPDPAREAAQREFSDIVGSCMVRLSPAQQEILRFRNLHDLSYGDIGRRLGVNIGTVKSRIARARRNLREAMAEAYPGRVSDRAEFAQWFETTRPGGLLAAATC